MARRPTKRNKENPGTASLLAALKMMNIVYKEKGSVNETHCVFSGGWAAASNGVLTVGAKVDTDLIAAPNIAIFLNALNRCDEATQITQLSDTRLSISSGRFRAFVPCVETGLLYIPSPDPPLADTTEKLTDALSTVGITVTDTAPRVFASAVMIQNRTCVATNGVILLEAYHGAELPEGVRLMLPKVFVTELKKIGKVPAKIGIGQFSVTVYFEDESFLRTQVYNETYPNTDRIFEQASENAKLKKYPADLIEGLEKLTGAKADEPRVWFHDKFISTAPDDADSFAYDIEGLPTGIGFNLEYLSMFLPLMEKVDFTTGPENKMLLGYGKDIRGVMMQVVKTS